MPGASNKLGQYLRSHREAKGLSLRALAAKVGVDYSYLHLLEAGSRKPSADVIERLARALGVRRTELSALSNDELPQLAPYLRAKYDLPDEAVAEIEEHFKAVRQQYKSRRGASS